MNHWDSQRLDLRGGDGVHAVWEVSLNCLRLSETYTAEIKSQPLGVLLLQGTNLHGNLV